jgi:hypothetical protein
VIKAPFKYPMSCVKNMVPMFFCRCNLGRDSSAESSLPRFLKRWPAARQTLKGARVPEFRAGNARFRKRDLIWG